MFAGERWDELVTRGAQPQRCLWASTSVKDPNLPDTTYVERLIGDQTVNTMPPETLRAVQDHGTITGPTITDDLDEAHELLEQLRSAGIDYDDVTAVLEDEGVKKFAASFQALFDGVEAKRDALAAGSASPTCCTQPRPRRPDVLGTRTQPRRVAWESGAAPPAGTPDAQGTRAVPEAPGRHGACGPGSGGPAKGTTLPRFDHVHTDPRTLPEPPTDGRGPRRGSFHVACSEVSVPLVGGSAVESSPRAAWIRSRPLFLAA